jgi:hypothetical protein
MHVNKRSQIKLLLLFHLKHHFHDLAEGTQNDKFEIQKARFFEGYA